LEVKAADFSVTASSLSGQGASVAGVGTQIELRSKDKYYNARDPRADNFKFSVAQSGAGVTAETTLQSSQIVNQYLFSYVANKAGYYTFEIMVDVEAYGGLISFKEQNVYVSPAAYESSTVAGDVSGGIQESEKTLTIKSLDVYLNPSDSARTDLYVVETNYQGTKVLTVAKFQLDKTTRQGSWTGTYKVPKITNDVEDFDIFVNHAFLNEGEDATKLTAEAILQKSSNTRVFAGAAQITAPASYLADNWPWIAGVCAGAALLLSGFGYMSFRLYRYKPKYKDARIRADEAEKMVNDINDEQILVGGANDWNAVGGATVTANPLHDLHKGRPVAAPEFEENLNATGGVEMRGPIKMEFKPAAPKSG